MPAFVCVSVSRVGTVRRNAFVPSVKEIQIAPLPSMLARAFVVVRCMCPSVRESEKGGRLGNKLLAAGGIVSGLTINWGWLRRAT